MSDFTKLYESTIQRFTRGGFLTGDLVKFTSNALSNEFVKKQAPNYASKIKEFIDSGLNLRVSSIKPVRPSSQPGNVQNAAYEFLIDVVLEKAPGLYFDFITVPAEMLEVVDTGINLAPVPNSLKREDNTTLKPEELNLKNGNNTYMSPTRQTRTTDRGDKSDSKTELDLPISNKKIPSSPAKDNRDPASYTARYLPRKS